MTQKIVLMACGSYSPPTYMHLRMFEIAKDYIHSFGLGTIIGGIMSPVHDAYKKKDLVAAHHRIAMLKLALRSSGWVKVSEWETQQAGWTRTKLSLQYHTDVLNEHMSMSLSGSSISCDNPPHWLPDDILNVNRLDEPDNLGTMDNPKMNGNRGADVRVKLLCGADLLESFATPGLWSDEDINMYNRAWTNVNWYHVSERYNSGRAGPIQLQCRNVTTSYKLKELKDHLPEVLRIVIEARTLAIRASTRQRLLVMANCAYVKFQLETIVGCHGLVVVTRAGCDPSRFIYESDLLYKYRQNITLVTNYVANEVSSTVIRRLVRRGESAKYLTDDAVLEYIRQNRLYGALPYVTEYNLLNELLAYDKKSPQDIIMTTPEETSFKSILISIRDKPSIKDETITVKRARKSNFLMPNHTDSVSPLDAIRPKMAYVDSVPPSYVPGKAVKIVSDAKQHAIKDKVSFSETTYSSLDSYLSQDGEYDYRRRVSEGNVGIDKDNQNVKKRCSASTIRKLKPDDMKKSKSEVSKLCDKMKSMKMKDNSKNYKTRSCNDIVRLILTKHGIHVISDTEAIV